MNSRSVPSAAILLTVSIYLVGVVLNYFLPTQIFEIVLNLASLGVLSTWSFIVLCQIRLRKAINLGELPATTFPMPWAPISAWLTLAFFAGVVVLMAFDYPNGTWTICCIPILAVLLIIGWKVFRRTPEPDSSLGPSTIPSIVLTDDVLENSSHAQPRDTPRSHKP